MRLVLNGDDFGFSHGVNLGFVDAFKNGVLNSASLMVHMPGAKEAAQIAKENPDLSVGLHFCITVGKPLTQGLKTLVKEDGTFNKNNLYDSSNVDEKEIYTELQAQYDKFIELVGRKPAHLNSHHGIEDIKGGEQAVCYFSKKYDIPHRRFFTLPKGNHPDTDYEVPINKATDIQFKEGTDLQSCFTQEEIESDDIFEYALHPGYCDKTVFELSSYTKCRTTDLAVFTSDEAKAFVDNPSIQLVGYEGCRKK